MLAPARSLSCCSPCLPTVSRCHVSQLVRLHCSEQTDEQAAVLHYSYNKFEDLKSRRDRCDCAPTDEDAKRCFILPFDRMVSRIRPSQLCAASSAACH